jgi:hypothetical protein
VSPKGPEFRRPLGDGILEPPHAALHQNHGGRGCHRLAHGGDAKDGIALDRQPSLDVAQARRIHLQQFTAPPYEAHHAGNIAGRNRMLGRGGDACGKVYRVRHDLPLWFVMANHSISSNPRFL